MSKRPLTLTIFIHEDLKDYDTDRLYLNHFDWILDELERISGRTMDMVFLPPADAPVISAYEYKNDDEEKSLQGLLYRVGSYKRQMWANHNRTYDDNLDKFMLLTRDNINNRVLGIANFPGKLAIASITSNPTPAHEIGHLFSARHADFDENISTYHGTYKSLMAPYGPAAFALSEKNRENIVNYLNQFD